MRSPLRLPLVAALVFASAAAFAAAPESKPASPAPAASADDGMPASGAAAGPFMTATPYKSEHVSCDRVVLTWPTASAGGLGGLGATSVTLRDEGGTSGLRFFVDRAHGGALLAVQTFREASGFADATTLPGVPRVDYVGCSDGETLGGIVLEWYDVNGT